MIIDETHAIPRTPPLIAVSQVEKNLPGIVQGPKRFRTETRSSGETVEIEEWRTSSSVKHRVGGPAVIERTPEGVVLYEGYLVEGRPSRLDGPAEVHYSRTTGAAWLEYYYLDGVRVVGGMQGLVGQLRRKKATAIRRLIEGSPYRALLDEGLRPAEVIHGLGHGVTSVEGVRQILGGAPVEWVRAWEEGSLGS